jgi:hypothetical protein
MNMLVVPDAKCCFTLIGVGYLGREKDSNDFINTIYGRAFMSGKINVPQMTNVPGTKIYRYIYIYMYI